MVGRAFCGPAVKLVRPSERVNGRNPLGSQAVSNCVKLSKRGNRGRQPIGAGTRFLWFVAAAMALTFVADALIQWKVF
jgi:hypothetical protein